MQSPYQEIREAFKKGDRLRATYLIEELQPKLGHKIQENFKTMNAYPLGKYSEYAINPSEKIYNDKLVRDLMQRTLRDADMEAMKYVSKIHQIAQQTPSNLKNSVEFSKMLFEAHQKSKFMPVKNAINKDLLYRLSSNKNNAVVANKVKIGELDRRMGALFDNLKTFGKGSIGGVLDIVNDFKNIGAGGAYLAGKYGGIEPLQNIGEQLSEKNLNVFAEDEDYGSPLYIAGNVGTMLGSIAYGSAYRAGRLTLEASRAGAKKLAQLYVKDFIWNTGKSFTVLGAVHVAGIASERVGEVLNLDAPTRNALQSTARMVTMRYIHKYLTEPLIGEIEAEDLENRSKSIPSKILKIKEEIDNEFERRDARYKEMNKTVFENPAEKESPNKTTSQSQDIEIAEAEGKELFPTNINGEIELVPEEFLSEDLEDLSKDDLIPLPNKDPNSNQAIATDEKGNSKFIDKYGNPYTIDDFNKSSSIISENGVIKVDNLANIDQYKSAAKSALLNSLYEKVKTDAQLGRMKINRIPSKDIQLIIDGIDFNLLDEFQLGAIARDPNNINLEAITDSDTSLLLAVVKKFLSSNKVNMEDYELMKRIAQIRQFCNMSGFDDTVSERFIASKLNQSTFSIEDIADATAISIEVAQKMIKDSGSAGYIKYHPKIAEFDTKSNANKIYIEKVRTKLTNEFDEMIRNPDYEYAFGKIADTKERQTTLGFDTVDGERVPRGAFYTNMFNLLSGKTEGLSFYESIKKARGLLSKNNPYGYQEVVIENSAGKPKLSGFVAIRKRIIDPMYEAMRKIREATLTKAELSEYLAGETKWKEVDSSKIKSLSKVFQSKVDHGNMKAKIQLYNNLKKDPSIITEAMKVIGKGFDLDSYISENASKLNSWNELINTGLAGENSNPFNVLRTIISLDELKDLLFVEEGLAPLADNIGSMKSTLLRKLHNFWDDATFKALYMFVDSDKRIRKARLRSGQFGMDSGSVIDEVIKYKKSKTQKSIEKAVVKSLTFKKLVGIVNAFMRDTEQETKEISRTVMIEAFQNFFSGNLLVQDALVDAIAKLGKSK